MAIGLVQSGQPAFQWFGDRILAAVNDRIDRKLYETGNAVVARAQALAPVDTGFLRSTINFIVRQNDHTLQIYADAFYAIFQEFGTRNIPPHPFLRPALLEIGRIWGGNIELAFGAMGGSPWQGIYAHKGSFILPSAIQPKPLTPKQRDHVMKHLVPTSKRLHRGNVKRAKMVVKRFD